MASTQNITTVAATTDFGTHRPAVKGLSVDHPVESMMDDNSADFWWRDDDSVVWFDKSDDDGDIKPVKPKIEPKIKEKLGEKVKTSPLSQRRGGVKKRTHKKATKHSSNVRRWLDACDKEEKESNGSNFGPIPQYPEYQADGFEYGPSTAEADFSRFNSTHLPILHGTQPFDGPNEVYGVESQEPELSLAERFLKIEKRMLHDELVILSVSGDTKKFNE